MEHFSRHKGRHLIDRKLTKNNIYLCFVTQTSLNLEKLLQVIESTKNNTEEGKNSPLQSHFEFNQNKAIARMFST